MQPTTTLPMTNAQDRPATGVALAVVVAILPRLAAAAPETPDAPAELGRDIETPVSETDPQSIDDVPEAEDVVQVRVAIEPDPLSGAQRLDADGLFESEQRAYRLYMDGVGILQNDEDPDAAILKWREALSVLPDERPYARSRGALALRLVTAYEWRFLRDGDLDDLRTQRALLEGYQQRLPEMFPDDAEERSQRHDHAQLRIDEIASELQRIGGDHGTAQEQLGRSLRGEYEGRGLARWRPDPTDMGWRARQDDPRKHARQAADAEAAPEQKFVAEEEPEPAKKQGTGLIVTGTVVGLAGLASIGVGVGGMLRAAAANDFVPTQTPSARRAQIDRGNRGNIQSVVGLSAGAVLAVSGVVLVAVGAKKRRKSSTLNAGPVVGRTTFGIALAGRF